MGKRFESGQPITTTTTQHSPARKADVQSDVVVPLLQSVITGILLAAILLGIIWYLNVDADWFSTYLTLVILITAIAWLWLLVQHRDLLWNVEKAINIDLNRDGSIGNPDDVADEAIRFILVNSNAAASAGERREAVRTLNLFRLFIRGSYNGDNTFDAWTDKKHGGQLTREQYTAWRDLLIRLGLAKWKSVNPVTGKPNVNSGWEYRATPEEIFTILKI